MSSSSTLVALLALIIGAVVAYAVATMMARKKADAQAATLKELETKLLTLSQDHQSLSVRQLELQGDLQRSETERKTIEENRASRIRDLELENERLKMTNSSHIEADAKLRQAEANNKALGDEVQKSAAQQQLIEARLQDALYGQQTLKTDLERRLMEKETEMKNREQRILEQQSRISTLEQEKEERLKDYDVRVQSLVQARKDMDDEKARLRESEEKERQELFEMRKKNWNVHEANVGETVKALCKKMEIPYYDSKTFPLGKKPDNAIEIGGQFVVLDAKAPRDPEHPENFFDYLKKQADQMDKYFKQDGVRREAFLIVPTDSLPYLEEKFYLEVGSNKIYVVTMETLEPVMRLYRKIEEYEVMSTLGPEAQDQIADFVGQASRMIKRRVQIDHFMSEKFIELLMTGDELPEDILKKSQAKERNFALNTPKMDRGKNLPTEDLKKKQNQLSFHIEGVDINAKVSGEALEGIPLEREVTPSEPAPTSKKKKDA